MTALRITDVTNSNGLEWFPDSGASSHVTSSPNHLQQAQVYSGSDSVMVGNGEFLPITHTGSISLASSSGNIPVSDVLVCPAIAKSLLSISKLTSDFPCSVDFDCDNVHIYDKQQRRFFFKDLTLKASTPYIHHLLGSSIQQGRSVLVMKCGIRDLVIPTP